MYECVTHVYMLTHVRINDGKIILHVACVSCDDSVPLCVCISVSCRQLALSTNMIEKITNLNGLSECHVDGVSAWKK